MEQSLTLIFIGRPGSGKSTQIHRLQEEFNCKIIGTGSLMRELAKQDSHIGKRLKKVLEDGGLPPEWLAMYLWINELMKIKPEDNIILDGSPRRLMEAKRMNSVLKWLGRNNARAFVINISEEESINRLTKRRVCGKCGNSIPYLPETKDLTVCNKCGGELVTRADDGVEDIKKKFGWYRKNVEKVIWHYRKLGKLIEINGERNIDEVYAEVKEKIIKSYV